MAARKLLYRVPLMRDYKEIAQKKMALISKENIGSFLENTPKICLDYFPYGMLLPNRHEAGNEYRYGFNGMEKYDEITGVEGSHLDFGARIYDSRVGRWLSVDKFSEIYTGISDYVFVGNNPLKRVDVDGNIWVDPEGRPIVTNTGNEITSSVPTNISKGMTLEEGEYYSDIVYSTYEEVTVYANDGTPIQAMRLVETHIEKNAIITFDKDGNVIKLKNGTNESTTESTYDVTSDCHGFTFANNKIWINNNQVDKLIIGDNWKKVEEKNADIVIYRKNEVDNTKTNVVHSAKRNSDGTYDYNAGITKGGENSTLENAAGGLQYSKTDFYKKTENNYIYNKVENLKIIGNTAEINLSPSQIKIISKTLKELASQRRNGN